MYDRFVTSTAKTLTCAFILFAALASPAYASALAKPEAIKLQALKVLSACAKKLDYELNKPGATCGNSGCSTHFKSCVHRGTAVVDNAIQKAVTQSARSIKKECHQMITSLAEQSLGAGQWLEQVSASLPAALDGDDVVLQRVFYYELIHRSASHPECKR
jgi:hypothetical protein